LNFVNTGSITEEDVAALLSNNKPISLGTKVEEISQISLLTDFVATQNETGIRYYSFVSGYKDGFVYATDFRADTIRGFQRKILTSYPLLNLYGSTGLFKGELIFSPKRRIIEASDPIKY